MGLHSQFRVWMSFAAVLVGISTIVPVATVNADEVAAPKTYASDLLANVRTLVYLNMAGFRDGVPEDSVFFRTWKAEAISFLAAGSGVDAASAASAAWLVYDEGIVVVYRFPAPVRHEDALAWFGSNPWRPRSDVTECYRFTDTETRVLLPGDRTVVFSGSATAIERFRRASEQETDPQRLLGAGGGNRDSDFYLKLSRPLPGELRSLVKYELADGEDLAADRLLARLLQVQLTVKAGDDVPLRLTLRTDSDKAAAELARCLADKVHEIHRSYNEGGRAALVADTRVPHTDTLIADVDRMVRGTLVSSKGNVVELRIAAPGGMPRLFELCVHEFARGSLQPTDTFDSVSEQLQEPEIEVEAARE